MFKAIQNTFVVILTVCVLVSQIGFLTVDHACMHCHHTFHDVSIGMVDIHLDQNCHAQEPKCDDLPSSRHSINYKKVNLEGAISVVNTQLIPACTELLQSASESPCGWIMNPNKFEYQPTGPPIPPCPILDLACRLTI